MFVEFNDEFNNKIIINTNFIQCITFGNIGDVKYAFIKINDALIKVIDDGEVKEKLKSKLKTIKRK